MQISPFQLKSSRFVVIALLLTGSLLTTLLAACNTTEGVGRDVESAGRGIEGAAQDAK